MTRQTDRPLTEYKLGVTREPAWQLHEQLRRGRLDLEPPYQRGAVWTKDQQIALVYSMISGIPIPTIVVNVRPGDRRLIRHVVDGKQRITAINAWFDGRLAVPATWFDKTDIVHATDIAPGGHLANEYGDYGDTGLYVFFPGLSDSAQAWLESSTTIPVAQGSLASEATEASLYGLLNGGGTPQTDADMDRARRIAEGQS